MQPKIETIELQKLSSGDRLYLQIYKFIGEKKGKKAYIQANLHGAEIVGNAVIYQLMEYLQTLKSDQIEGEIWLVPVCNPVGVNQRTHLFSTGRFNPYDGKDWNRIFWDYEKENPYLRSFAISQMDFNDEQIRKNFLAKISDSFEKKRKSNNTVRGIDYSKRYSDTLQSLCLDANYVIDIHSSSMECISYLYSFESRRESAEYLLFDYGILMDYYEGMSFDEAFLKPWLALEKTFKSLGKKVTFDLESWTLELGSGMKINTDYVLDAVTGIKNYLTFKKMLNLPTKLIRKKVSFVKQSDTKSYYAVEGGMIQNRKKVGTKVNVGEQLYEILKFNKSGELPTIMEVRSQDQGLIVDVSCNEAVNQGEYVLGIFPHV